MSDPSGGARIDPGVMQDLPHRGGSDRMAKPDQLALHAPMASGGICPSRCGSRAFGSWLPYAVARDAADWCSPIYA